jgi:hypothetical protein
MKNSISGGFPSIATLLNAVTIGALAIACALFVAVSGIPGLTP